MFDEVSKECCDFDRKWNIWYPIDGNDRHQILIDTIDGFHTGRLSSSEIIEICDNNIADMLKRAEPIHHIGWNEAVRQFAKERPSGSFFMASDHDSYEAYDIIQDFGYKVVNGVQPRTREYYKELLAKSESQMSCDHKLGRRYYDPTGVWHCPECGCSTQGYRTP
jgi:hypothetical protein